jgi:glyoxylase-like metal-dependent hydrolase (beta-lactamase superfamily II)
VSTSPIVHRIEGRSLPVNAWVVESSNALVLVDSALTVSDGRAVRERLQSLGKPLVGAIVTHAHPDHYGALVEVIPDARMPIVAVKGVEAAIRRQDADKERILRPMFGDEWPRRRLFPNRTVSGGESVAFDGISFTVRDLGPGESPHDSLWALEGSDVAFVGDLVYNHMHAYLADGYWERWLRNLDTARSLLAPGAVLHPGHGDRATIEQLDWQEQYIRTFVGAVRSAGGVASPEAAVEQVTAAMKTYLPSESLLFLMQLSVPSLWSAGGAGADATGGPNSQ